VKTKNIHANFFNKLLKENRNVIDALKLMLPPEISEMLDFRSIVFDDSSYVDDKLVDSLSDIVIKTMIKDKYHSADIYILLEHKSSKPKKEDLFFQILKYIYNMWLLDYSTKKPFRVIIPLVFYHGKQKWNLPERFIDQFQIRDDLKKIILDFSYILYNTNNIDDLEFQKSSGNAFLKAGLISLKHSFEKEKLENVVNIIEYIYSEGLFEDDNKVEYIIRYLSLRYELTVGKIRKIIKKLTIKRSDAMKTFIDYYEEKGIEKEKIETAKKMLVKGYHLKEIKEITGLTEKQIKKLLLE